MHVRTATLLLALLLPALPRAAPEVKPERRARVAVLGIRALGTEPILCELLSEVALTESSAGGKLEIIGASDVAALVGLERQKKVLGCGDDAACLVEVGGALGVDDLLVGTLGRIGALYRVDLKLVDTRKARVLSRFGESVAGREDQLVAAVQRGVRQVLAPLVGPAPEGAQGSFAAAPAPAAGISSRRAWGWAAAGSGAALVGAGVVFGLQAQKAYREEKAAAAGGDLPGYTASRDRVRSRALAADACYAAGALALAGGAWLLLGRSQVAVVPAAGGAAAVVAGSF
ncbi:MAG TPA: hypothetical protein VH880_05435 [Anaeromyxobacteraceae bacterium]